MNTVGTHQQYIRFSSSYNRQQFINIRSLVLELRFTNTDDITEQYCQYYM